MNPDVVYLVQKYCWRINEYNQEEVKKNDPRPDVRADPDDPSRRIIVVYCRSEDEGGEPVRAFHDRGKADRFCRKLEQERRERTNPFRYGNLHDQWTSLDEDRLRDWLLDAGLTPPTLQGLEKPQLVAQNWIRWWSKLRPNVTDAQRKALANALFSVNPGTSSSSDRFETHDDLAALDARLNAMDQVPADQRTRVRASLWSMGLWDHPQLTGERKFEKVAKSWRDWWDRESPKMTALQREHVWAALDKVRFYEVVELI